MIHNATVQQINATDYRARCPVCRWHGQQYHSPAEPSVQAAREAREHNEGAK